MARRQLPPWVNQVDWDGLETREGLPKGTLKALAEIESGFRADVLGPETKYGRAIGAFQFLEGTARDYGIDPLDPVQAADGAARYLGKSLRKYGNIEAALASYNWGPGNVERKGMDRMPEETRNYIAKYHRILGTHDSLPVDPGAPTGPASPQKKSEEALLADNNGIPSGITGVNRALASVLPAAQAAESAPAPSSGLDLTSMYASTFGAPQKAPQAPAQAAPTQPTPAPVQAAPAQDVPAPSSGLDLTSMYASTFGAPPKATAQPAQPTGATAAPAEAKSGFVMPTSANATPFAAAASFILQNPDITPSAESDEVLGRLLKKDPATVIRGNGGQQYTPGDLTNLLMSGELGAGAGTMEQAALQQGVQGLQDVGALVDKYNPLSFAVRQLKTAVMGPDTQEDKDKDYASRANPDIMRAAALIRAGREGQLFFNPKTGEYDRSIGELAGEYGPGVIASLAAPPVRAFQGVGALGRIGNAALTGATEGAITGAVRGEGVEAPGESRDLNTLRRIGTEATIGTLTGGGLSTVAEVGAKIPGLRANITGSEKLNRAAAMEEKVLNEEAQAAVAARNAPKIAEAAEYNARAQANVDADNAALENSYAQAKLDAEALNAQLLGNKTAKEEALRTAISTFDQSTDAAVRGATYADGRAVEADASPSQVFSREAQAIQTKRREEATAMYNRIKQNEDLMNVKASTPSFTMAREEAIAHLKKNFGRDSRAMRNNLEGILMRSESDIGSQITQLQLLRRTVGRYSTGPNKQMAADAQLRGLVDSLENDLFQNLVNARAPEIAQDLVKANQFYRDSVAPLVPQRAGQRFSSGSTPRAVFNLADQDTAAQVVIRAAGKGDTSEALGKILKETTPLARQALGQGVLRQLSMKNGEVDLNLARQALAKGGANERLLNGLFGKNNNELEGLRRMVDMAAQPVQSVPVPSGKAPKEMLRTHKDREPELEVAPEIKLDRARSSPGVDKIKGALAYGSLPVAGAGGALMFGASPATTVAVGTVSMLLSGLVGKTRDAITEGWINNPAIRKKLITAAGLNPDGKQYQAQLGKLLGDIHSILARLAPAATVGYNELDRPRAGIGQAPRSPTLDRFQATEKDDILSRF